MSAGAPVSGCRLHCRGHLSKGQAFCPGIRPGVGSDDPLRTERAGEASGDLDKPGLRLRQLFADLGVYYLAHLLKSARSLAQKFAPPLSGLPWNVAVMTLDLVISRREFSQAAVAAAVCALATATVRRSRR